MEDLKLRELVHAVVSEGRAAVLALKSERALISRHWRYPKLGRFDGGLPNVSHIQDGPIDYSALFKYAGAGIYDIAFDVLATLPNLRAHIEGDQTLRSRVLLPATGDGDPGLGARIDEISVALLPLDLLDRLMNRHGETFGEEAFEDEWRLLAAWLSAEQDLPVEVVVPLAMTTCETDDPFKLAPDVRIERIPDDEHLARVPDRLFGAEAHPCVLSAASHGVVFGGLVMPAINPMLSHLLVPEVVEPSKIDQTFQSLRLASGLPLGYAQVYVRPIGWSWRFDADLPTVIDPQVVRRYPPSFNAYAWNKPPNVLTVEHLEAAKQLRGALASAPSRMALAARRFGQAQLRDTTEDAVLDLCIALEAALGDSGRAEMTHKVAMRAAALLAPDGPCPARIKRLVKRLYDWRSALVHGDDVRKPIKRFVGEDKSDAEAALLAMVLVQQVLASLLRREDIARGEDLDDLMLRSVGPASDGDG